MVATLRMPFHFLENIDYIVGDFSFMKRKIAILLSCVCLLVSCASCDSTDEAVSVETTPVVAVASDTGCMLAAEEYCKSKGYEMMECGSAEDAVVFVENGKYDYVVLDEFTTIVPEDYNLRLVEECEYSARYSLCFYGYDQVLQDGINGTIIDLNSDGTIDEIISNHYEGIDNDVAISGGDMLRVVCSPYYDDRVCFDEDGNICGIDVDIMTAICSQLGYTPVFISAEYDEVFTMLEEGYGDVALMIDEASWYDSDKFILSEVYLEKNYYVYESNVK